MVATRILFVDYKIYILRKGRRMPKKTMLTTRLPFKKLPIFQAYRFINQSSINNDASTAVTIQVGTLEAPPEILDEAIVEKRQIIGQLNHSQTNNGIYAPKVYMLGWGGSIDKQLHRYSKLYEQQGYDTTRYIAPLLKAPSLVHAHPFAAEFHQNVSVYEANTRQIVFHLFSMNGCMVFTALWELWSKSLQGEELKKRVKGIIFDSGPSDCLPSNSALALSSTAVPVTKSKTDKFLRSMAYAFFYAYFAGQRISASAQSLIEPSRFNDYFAYYRLQEFNDLPKQQLYLYSTKDCIIDHTYVDKFIEQQQKHGAQIQSRCFSDTPHVSHMRKHQEEYSKLCIDFTKSAISN